MIGFTLLKTGYPLWTSLSEIDCKVATNNVNKYHNQGHLFWNPWWYILLGVPDRNLSILTDISLSLKCKSSVLGLNKDNNTFFHEEHEFINLFKGFSFLKIDAFNCVLYA